MGVDVPVEYDRSWPVVSLAEITTKIGSGATPRGGSDAYFPSRTNFALVRSQNVFDRRFERAGLAFISDEQADGLRNVVLKPDDILLNITGDGVTLGRACIVPTEVLPACVNQHVSIIRLNPERAHAGYVLAFLTHPNVKQYIESFNAGGSRRAITKGHIESFRLPLPPLPVQQAMAHILGTLDEKIDLNRRMNETLEAMARVIFKNWFVDFGPTRAKLDGRPPYLEPKLWALFPDRLDIEGRPEGWPIGTMSDLLHLQRGFDLPSHARRDGPYPIIAASGPNGFHDSYLVSGPGVTTGRSGVLGKVFFVQENFWPLNTSLWVKEFRRATPSFAYFYLCNIDFAAFNAGSAVPTLNRNHIHGLPVVLPPDELISAFDNIAMPLLRRHRHSIMETETIEATRDLLLPKLMTGEIQLREAEKALEAVA